MIQIHPGKKHRWTFCSSISNVFGTRDQKVIATLRTAKWFTCGEVNIYSDKRCYQKFIADHWNLTSINSEKVVPCGEYDHKRKKKKKSKPETEMPHKDQATSQDSKHFNHMEWVSFSQHNEFRRTSRSQWADNCVCKISKFKVLMSLKCASTLVPISSFNLLCNTENKIKLLNYFWEILISERMVMPTGYAMWSAVGPKSDSSSGLYSTKLHTNFSQHKTNKPRFSFVAENRIKGRTIILIAQNVLFY